MTVRDVISKIESIRKDIDALTRMANNLDLKNGDGILISDVIDHLDDYADILADRQVK